jgi:DNA polymerase elongation subunit (family B)
MKILLLDIETAPHLAYVWGIHNENIPIQRIVKAGYVMSWAAKWHGEKDIYYSDLREGAQTMLERIHHLLSEADVVVHFYGSKFDIPQLNREFLLAGMEPPAPYKEVDLHTTVRRKFKFASNKLDFVCQMLNIGAKVQHRGFDLWIDCMNGNREAYEELKTYNIADVHPLLEGLYDRILPWIINHPNRAVYNPVDGLVCPKCGGKHYQKRGTAVTAVAMYQRYQCQECFNWFRDNINVGKKAKERFNNV